MTWTFSQGVGEDNVYWESWGNFPFTKSLWLSVLPLVSSNILINILGKRCLNFLECAEIVSDTCSKYERGQQTWPGLTHWELLHKADSISITEPALQRTQACCTLQRRAHICIQALHHVEVSSIRFQLDLAEGRDKPKPSLVSSLCQAQANPSCYWDWLISAGMLL